MTALIDFSQANLWTSAAFICFNPTLWNLGARSEYHHKTITRLFNGNTLAGCYAFAAVIFSLGILRDIGYDRALDSQPSHPALDNFVVHATGAALIAWGSVLVLSSMWALGVLGTYLGDYFGFFFDDMVTGFPFNVSASPMYNGSTMCFLGRALWVGKPAGILLSALVFAVYKIALAFEDPFTAKIYANVSKGQNKGRSGHVVADLRSSRSRPRG